jgi:hypothetical protein
MRPVQCGRQQDCATVLSVLSIRRCRQSRAVTLLCSASTISQICWPATML